jgi:hypothetical protein
VIHLPPFKRINHGVQRERVHVPGTQFVFRIQFPRTGPWLNDTLINRTDAPWGIARISSEKKLADLGSESIPR